jgi:hypothetical protein
LEIGATERFVVHPHHVRFGLTPKVFRPVGLKARGLIGRYWRMDSCLRRNDKKKRRTAFGYRNCHSLPFVNPRAFSFSEAVRKWCCTLDNLDSRFRGNDKPRRTDTDQLDYFHNALSPYGKRDCNSLNLYIYLS